MSRLPLCVRMALAAMALLPSAAGSAHAAPMAVAARPQPNRLPVEMLGPDGSEARLLGLFSTVRPEALFGLEKLVTRRNLPRAVRFLPGQKLAPAKGPLRLKAGPAVVDLSRTDTAVKIGSEHMVFRPGPDLADVLNARVAVTIDSLCAVAHGRYLLNFRYTANVPALLRLPLRFLLTAEGEVVDYASYQPYAHTQGPADDLQGVIPITIFGESAPIRPSCTSIGITVEDGNGQEIGTFKKTLNTRLSKLYADTTRDNIRDYLAGPNREHVLLRILGNTESVQSLSRGFLLEPALVLVKTNQGNFAKVLMDVEEGQQGRWHLRIWDARCYDRRPERSNTEPIQSFGRGGYLLNPRSFDLDCSGANPGSGELDVYIDPMVALAEQRIQTHTLARMAW